VAFHAANDSFHSAPGKISDFIAMLGGEFVTHGNQQKAKMKLVSPEFPGTQDLGDGFEMLEEWYALNNFAKDLHVILVQETAGMKDACYQRPPFPATWARKHGKGRVFYTSLGHREDVWTSKIFQQIVLGGFAWAMGHVEADVPANIDKVTPKANEMKN
jgi:type 1 glutamine amidotransferase